MMSFELGMDMVAHIMPNKSSELSSVRCDIGPLGSTLKISSLTSASKRGLKLTIFPGRLVVIDFDGQHE